MSKRTRLAQVVAGMTLALSAATLQAAPGKPNVILIFMDNFAYGELGSYGGGITRGAATPRLDTLAAEGFRSTNFNVEAQCTPSRASIMTGRYALRTGNSKVPFDRAAPYGLTQWEYTMAEMFKDAGYSTAMYGKWHLGDRPGRFPTDQGFDQWWGIPNSTDEAWWANNDRIPADVKAQVNPSQVLAVDRPGGEPVVVKPFDLKQRAVMDGELTEHSIQYIKQHAKAEKPFFLFLPYTQAHQPRLVSPEFDGKTGNGVWADLLMQTDTYVGRILDTLKEKGIEDNTIVIFTSDNGGDFYDDSSFAGPWRGTYFTGLEGSLRVPFIARFPGKIPAGQASNELMHESDLLPTLAAYVGGKVPTDRVIDGIDMSAFLVGKAGKSGRESVMVYVGNQLHAVKWRNWKGVFKELPSGYGSALKEYPTPLVFDLFSDPREEKPLAASGLQRNGWVAGPIIQALMGHMKSLRQEPPIKEGTPDPYVPHK